MDEDIVPELLKKIKNDFEIRKKENKVIGSILINLENQKATYLDANLYAVELGQILSDVLGIHITPDVLPDGKMYFNIADRVLNETLKENFDLISNFSTDVETILNKKAKIGLKTQLVELNQDRLDGLVNRLSSEVDFENAKWLLGEPIVNFSQSVVDDIIKANAEFHKRAGLNPTIERTLVGKPCKWCKNLAGSYAYPNVPDDVYHRHERCRCTVDYNPKGSKRQNVWSKDWN